MPNHVTNILKIEGDEEIVAFVFGIIQGDKEEQVIDFRKIIPYPPFLYTKDAGSCHEGIAAKLSTPIWTNWNRDNWSTKWNAYSMKKREHNSIEFETAWSRPKKVIDALAAKFPQLKITHTFADEDTGSNVGIIVYEGGKTTENICANRSKEAFELSFLLHPEMKELYQLVDGEYVFMEE